MKDEQEIIKYYQEKILLSFAYEGMNPISLPPVRDKS